MREIRTTVLALTALAALAGGAAALTVEEVTARHVAARGGAEAWNAVDSMKVSGQFTAFSKIHPFTLYRQRGDGDVNRFYCDQIQDGKKVVTGFDGEQAWMLDGWNLGWEQPLGPGEPDYQVMVQDAEMATPLFGWKERGYEAELLGEGEVDGIEVVQVKLKRHGWEETWHLDPETFLEVARDAPASEFGRPAVARTFYDDFRQVGGLVMPHYVESQWYTRHRVYEIEDVELDVAVDGRMFAMPPPAGMGVLLPMVGEWDVKVERRGRPQQEFQESRYGSRIEPLVGGALLQEHVTTADGGQIVRTYAYDRFNEVYRVQQVNGQTTHPNLLVGTFEDGRLTVSNAETGTAAQMFGRTWYERTSVFDLGEGGFKAERETSFDGEEWFVSRKMTYAPSLTPQPPLPEGEGK